MGAPGGMFAADAEFSELGADELIRMVQGSGSVIVRGRAMLEVGRRASRRPELRQRLFEWAEDASYAERSWFGQVSLAWIAACCLGYSLTDPPERARLAETLRRWPDSERDPLLRWAGGEGWFDGMS